MKGWPFCCRQCATAVLFACNQTVHTLCRAGHAPGLIRGAAVLTHPGLPGWQQACAPGPPCLRRCGREPVCAAAVCAFDAPRLCTGRALLQGVVL